MIMKMVQTQIYQGLVPELNTESASKLVSVL